MSGRRDEELVRKALRSAHAGEPIPSFDEVLGRRHRPSPAWQPVTAGAVLLLAALAVGWWTLDGRRTRALTGQEQLALATELSSVQAPLDFLLDAPGDELLDLPSFDLSDPFATTPQLTGQEVLQ